MSCGYFSLKPAVNCKNYVAIVALGSLTEQLCTFRLELRLGTQGCFFGADFEKLYIWRVGNLPSHNLPMISPFISGTSARSETVQALAPYMSESWAKSAMPKEQKPNKLHRFFDKLFNNTR